MKVCSHCGAVWDERHERGECGVMGATARLHGTTPGTPESLDVAREQGVRDPEREWIVTVRWVDGLYVWTLYDVPPGDDFEVGDALASGAASTVWGVRWQAWRARRRLKIPGGTNVKGKLPMGQGA